MPGRLNVGVIGVGRLGRVYAGNLAQRVPNARLVAVADQKEELARSIAAEFNVPKAYGDYRELLADPAVDAVAVITSTSTHHDVVIDAAASGKAMFCEKPISLSLEGALEMIRAVERNGAFLQMGFQRRFDAAYLGAKKGG